MCHSSLLTDAFRKLYKTKTKTKIGKIDSQALLNYPIKVITSIAVVSIRKQLGQECFKEFFVNPR